MFIWLLQKHAKSSPKKFDRLIHVFLYFSFFIYSHYLLINLFIYLFTYLSVYLFIYVVIYFFAFSIIFLGGKFYKKEFKFYELISCLLMIRTISLFTVYISHLHYNVLPPGCKEISGWSYKIAQSFLTYILDYIEMQMRRLKAVCSCTLNLLPEIKVKKKKIEKMQKVFW